MSVLLIIGFNLFGLVNVGNAQQAAAVVTFSLVPDTYNGFNISCNAGNDGGIDLTVTSGTAPFTFKWSNGAITEDVTSLTAGTYSVTVYDAVLDSANQSITLTQPPAILISPTSIVNVACNGASTGIINITVSGGVSPYSFLWSNAATTEDISSLAAGAYTVTVADLNGCTSTLSSTITQPPVLTISSITPSNVSCFGFADGTIDVIVAGGTTAYSYLWSNGVTTKDLNSLSPGTYTITVTDMNSCTVSANTSITQPAALVVSVADSTNISCNGGNNGSIDISVAGGTPAYNYVWSNGATTQDISSVLAGIYTVTVSDQNSCTATKSIVLSQPTVLTLVNDSVNHVSCNGFSDAAIYVSASGGISPYTFLWSDASTLEDRSGLIAGLYTVTVTDQNACTVSINVNVTQPPVLTVGLNTKINVSCNGFSNGSIDINVGGGTLPYSYIWSNAATTQDISGLVAGTYTVTVTDANNCIQSFGTTITQPTLLIVATSDSSNVTCNGQSDGTIELLVSGGTTPYTYLWSNGATTKDIINLVAGTYTVTVTDNNSCITSHVVTIFEPPVLNVTLDSTVNVSCNSGSDGKIFVSVTGGNPGYFYNWSNGSGTQDLSALVAGTYTLTVTDTKGCVDSLVAVITEPTALSLGLTPSLFTGGNNISCYGSVDGTITSSASGGTFPYTYSWNTGNTTANLNGFGAGTYTVVLTDLNGCTIAAMQMLTQPDSVQVSLNAVTGTCGSSNGSASTVSTSGGIGPYTYLWSTGSTNLNISSLAQGLYTITVTDVNACTAVRSVFVPNTGLPVINLNQIVSVACNGDSTGSILVTTNAATPPYTFLWNDGSTTEDLSSVPSGTYTLTVTDNIGCVSSSSFTVSQPNAISTSLSAINSTCGNANGFVILGASGGTGTFSYLWSNGKTTQNLINVLAGTYSVTVTDVNGCTAQDSVTLLNTPRPVISVDTILHVLCNGSATGSVQISVSSGTGPFSFIWTNGSTSEDQSLLNAGTYTVTVTDQNNCTRSQTVVVSQPPAITLSFNIINTTCGLSNGSAVVTTVGGISPYTFLWSNGNTTDSIAGLASGTYTVTVADQNGCTKSGAANISDLGGPSVTLSSQTNITCFGGNNGAIDVNVSGGTVPYSYLWSTGGTTQDLTGLIAGTYTLTVTDSTNCATSFTVVLTEPDDITIVPTLTHTTCGFANGSIVIVAMGGTGTLSYLWSTGATTSSISSVAAGNYTVTVTDINACSKSASFTLVNAPGPVLALDSIVNVSCFGLTDGAIYINTSSGTIPFSYLWSDGSTSEDNINIAQGIYTLTITDVNGCTVSISAAVNQPSAIMGNIVTGNSTCGNPNGTATISASGGGGVPYSFLWSNGSTNQIQVGLLAGVYSVTITDSDGCTIQMSDTVFNTSGASITLNNKVNVLCIGDSTGSIDINVTGGTPAYSYLWSNGATTQDISGLTAGTYTIIVSDQNSCNSVLALTITQPTQISISLNSVNSTCGNPNGVVLASANGGVGPYSYLWSTGSTNASIAGLNAGTYTVTVTDANSCTRSKSVVIFTTTAPTIALSTFSNVTCNGLNNGFLNIQVSGGSSPYSFLWSNGTTTEDVSMLAPGTYTVTVTDNIGCQGNNAFVISEPSKVMVALSVVNATCSNNNGKVTAVASGGVGSFTYIWSNGITTAANNNLPAGNYTVTVTDLNGCTAVDSATVNFFNSPVVSLASKTDVSCFGGNNGAISTTVTGGTAPFNFSWTNTGQSNQNITMLTAGNYILTVTDANGCTSTLSVDILQPAALTATTSKVNANCGNSNGSAMVSAMGGIPPYTYLWSNGNTTDSIGGLFTGSYTITVTDINGCTVSSSVLIFNTPVPNISLVALNNVSCNSGSDGAINILVSGGTSPYTFLWSNSSTTQNISSLIAGTYTITVSDFNGCTSLASYVVGQPPAVIASISGNNSICVNNNGSATASASGGQGSYTYLWSSGQTTASITGLSAGTYTVTVSDLNMCTDTETIVILFLSSPVPSLVSKTDVACNGDMTGSIDIDVTGGMPPYTYMWTNTTQNTQDLINVGANIYTVTVTDGNGCTGTLSITVNQPPALIVTTSPNSTTCGNSNGSAGANASGGTPPYSYIWSTGSTNQFITGLSQGVYTVTVTDSFSCTKVAQAIISDFGGPVVTVDSVNHILCNGDNNAQIFLSVSGGTSPYTYLWSTGSTVEDLLGINGGVYTITVTDSNSCATSTAITVNEPAALSLAFTVSQPSCGASNGFVSANISGGTFPFSYLWSTGITNQSISGLNTGVFTVTVTDANNCVISDTVSLTNSSLPVISLDSIKQVFCNGGNNGLIMISVINGIPPYSYLWSDGSTVQDRSGLNAGQYTVTVTDAIGCFANALYVITEPTALVLNLTKVNALCQNNNGSISSVVTGGTGIKAYLWSNGATTSGISGLAGGNYTVTVTDANNCTISASETITYTPGPSVALISKVDVLCAGNNTGSIDINVTGGAVPYLFSWTNTLQVTEDLINLTANTYTVTVTDNNGCTVSLTVVITQPAAINFTAIPNNATCGNNNGSVITNIAGGVSPYTYLWSDGSTLPFITNKPQGTYTVTVTDNNGCTKSSQATVNDFGLPAITVDSVSTLTCNGSGDGAIFLSIGGGLPPYTYLWSNGSTTINLSGLAGGTYTVTVTDSLSCTKTLGVPVAEPAVISIGLSKSDPTCASANGVVSANVSGGTGPYSYLWSNGSTFSSIGGLGPATYTLSITDINGCTSSASIVLTGSSVPVISLDSVTNVLCKGQANGAINISITNGTSPYTYLWSDGVTLQDRSGLLAGQYTITVTDNLGCFTNSVFVVNQPSALTVQLNKTDAVCQNNNGAISSSTTGGTGAVSVLWSTGAIVANVSGLASGTYTVTVTDENGCTATGSTVILFTPGPSVTLNTKSDVLCSGDSTGSVDINVSGGTMPFTYSWTNTTQTSQDILNLFAGTYVVTVTDANMCTTSFSVTVNEPNPLMVGFTTNNASCGAMNGSVKANVIGGQGLYSYLWSTGATTDSISSISTGNYTVTVTDANMCSTSGLVTLSNTGIPNIILDNINNVLCNGNPTGSISISVNNGMGPYTYLWSNGSTVQDQINLVAGVYTIVVTDLLGCSDSSSFNINQPPVLSLNLVPISPSCNQANGSLTANVNGGAFPYSYLWSTGGTTNAISALNSGLYTVTVTDNNNCIITDTVTIFNTGVPVITVDSIMPVSCFGGNNGAVNIFVNGGSSPYNFFWSNGSSNQNIAGLIATIYTVTLTDNKGCTVTASVIVPQPADISISMASTSASCNFSNGTATATVNGGVFPYTYQWSNGSTTSAIIGLSAGIYVVTVTDIRNCTKTASVNVTNLGAPSVSLNLKNNVSCFGLSDGNIDINVSGLGIPFTYLWSNGATTQDIAGLPVGTYTITVTDNNGCIAILSVPINQPAKLQLVISGTNPSCGNANGAATVLVAGGNSPYTYLWSTGAMSATVGGLAGLTYTVTVTDFKGCQDTASITLTNTTTPIVMLNTISNVSCNGLNDGSIAVNINGGTPPYTYLWSNTVQTADSIFNLSPGTYNVTVTDSVGCQGFASYSIGEPDLLTGSVATTIALCNGANGTATATVFGGTLPYSFLWSNGATVSTIIGLTAGTYTVSITDNRGCTFSSFGTISNTGGPIVSIVDTNNIQCHGSKDGSIILSVSGGTPFMSGEPYLYMWNDTSLHGPSVMNLAPGVYIVTIIDSIGCQTTTAFNITTNPPIVIKDSIPVLNGVFNISCSGRNDGEVYLKVSGGVGPYNYLWSTGASISNVKNLVAATYTVTITDSKGCIAVRNFVLNQPPPVIALAGSDKSICGTFSDSLNALVPAYGLGSWSVIQGSGTFFNPNLANTIVNGLSININVLQWTVSDGVCTDSSRLSIIVRDSIFAVTGKDIITCDRQVSPTALDPQFGFGYWTVLFGNSNITDSMDATPHVTNYSVGPNIFQWTVKNGECIDSAKVVITIRDSSECLEPIDISTGFTPNNDGKNDFFIISGIDAYPDNSLSVFNRWGQIVYETNNYRNNWQGKSNKGNVLPEGTYFVVFKVRGQSKVYKSYLDLRR